jgi:hypothetical protein
MQKEVLHRSAADNEYLHKDFHGALSTGIEYLHRRYGAEAVREYLWQFASTFYAPLIADINSRGLVALQEHFQRIYEREGGEFSITLTGDSLSLDIQSCPAVRHMREIGYPVADLFYETTRTVNEAICAGTPFQAKMLSHDPQTGRSFTSFTRRES